MVRPSTKARDEEAQHEVGTKDAQNALGFLILSLSKDEGRPR
jgi:hypothetical protein